MSVNDAKQFVGFPIRLTWTGRKGDPQSDVVYVFSVGFVPLYGPCLITDKGEIRIDRVVNAQALVQQKAS